jgi:hypothetical protein
MSPPENRITDLGVFSGWQLLLVFLAVLGLGILIGQRWPVGRLAVPADWRKALWSGSWLCLAAPALGFIYVRTGHSMDYDQADVLLGFFFLGVFLHWFSAQRTKVPT